jgi:hypothetical protein
MGCNARKTNTTINYIGIILNSELMKKDIIMYLSLQVTKKPRFYLLHPQPPLSTTINPYNYASFIRSHTVYKLQHIVTVSGIQLSKFPRMVSGCYVN